MNCPDVLVNLAKDLSFGMPLQTPNPFGTVKPIGILTDGIASVLVQQPLLWINVIGQARASFQVKCEIMYPGSIAAPACNWRRRAESLPIKSMSSRLPAFW